MSVIRLSLCSENFHIFHKGRAKTLLICMCQLLNSTKLEKFPKTDNTRREQLNARRPLLPLENQPKFINIADKSVGRRVAGRALQRDIGIVVYTHIAFFRIRAHHDIYL